MHVQLGDIMTFTFMHLADAFIQSDLQCIQVIHFYESFEGYLIYDEVSQTVISHCVCLSNRDAIHSRCAYNVHLFSKVCTVR